MINKRNILQSLMIFILTLIIISCGEEKIENEKITKNFKFTEDSAINILNPDRGFYDATYSLNEENELSSINRLASDIDIK